MRDILFKAKRIDTGDWVEGYLFQHEPPLQCCLVPENYIAEKSTWFILNTAFADWDMPRPVEYIVVDPDTICEYTGLLDKNGTKIFEGDIVLHGYINQLGSFYDELPVSYKVNHGGYIIGESKRLTPKMIEQKNVEVIGNIHDKEATR